jgi:hypothetical protein
MSTDRTVPAPSRGRDASVAIGWTAGDTAAERRRAAR